jgi:hypothetical protein
VNRSSRDAGRPRASALRTSCGKHARRAARVDAIATYAAALCRTAGGPLLLGALGQGKRGYD